MRARLYVVIRGRVQGVGFRYSAYRQAQALGVAGWVRNRADGSVEAEVEGERSALEAFLEWCQDGPPLARVAAVEPVWSEARGSYAEIEIR